MHNIVHNWSDEPARKMLEMLKPAMTPNYSTLLVHDYVVPESHPNPQATSVDLMMIAVLSAIERTESMWRALFESAGFRIIKIWNSPLMTMSIIEAEPIHTAS